MHGGSESEHSRVKKNAASSADLVDAAWDTLADEVESLCQRALVHERDFEAMEQAARTLGLSLVCHLVESCMNADTGDCPGPETPCPDCQQMARHAGRRKRTLTTALGTMTLERAWHHCAHCHSGFAPRDHQLHLQPGSLSPAVTRMVGITAGRISFERSSDLIRALAGLTVSAKTVERHAESLGRRIAGDEADWIEVEPSQAGTLYLGMDGTGIPVRKSETAGRKGKQADGRAKTREVKLACVWSAESVNQKTGNPQRDPGAVTCSAAIESIASLDTDSEPAAFSRRVERELERRGFRNVVRRVGVADGAVWIWIWTDEQVPDAIQVVDIHHAKEHVGDAARAIFGDHADLGKAWSRRWRDELDQPGGVKRLVKELRSHGKVVRSEVKYFTNNRKRMRYSKFRAQGICVSSGVLEGACKSIVGNRLKLGGMHWTVEGANAIIALRCCVESNRFDDFRERQVGAM